VKKYCRAGQAIDEIWRVRIACWIPKATDTHSEYVILIDFTFRQRSSVVRCMYFACLVKTIWYFHRYFEIYQTKIYVHNKEHSTSYCHGMLCERGNKCGMGGECRTQGENVNPLHTKRRPLYLKTQFLPRCKHFSSRL